MGHLTKMNSNLNGSRDNSFNDDQCFLFTSESVGEGHPGELARLPGQLSASVSPLAPGLAASG